MRRANGSGCVKKLAGKRRKPYAVVITVGWTLEGKQINKYLGYFSTAKEATKFLTDYIDTPYNIDNDLTFKEVYDKWSFKKYTELSDSAIRNYKASFNKSKKLHGMTFRSIKLNHLQQVIDSIGDSWASKRLTKVLYNQLYTYAMKYDIVSKDYSKFVEIGKKVTKLERKIFTKEEINILWEHVGKIDYVDTVLILIYTGLRIGELLNLKISNINLDEGYLKGGSKTEAGKDRIIPLNRKILPLITRRINQGIETTYLINSKRGSGKMSYSVYSSQFNFILNELGMEHTIHDTRHTFATLLSNAEANVTSIKRLIGHSNYEMTEKVYTHKDLEQLKQAIDLL